jgi:hypothetical protein
VSPKLLGETLGLTANQSAVTIPAACNVDNKTNEVLIHSPYSNQPCIGLMIAASANAFAKTAVLQS